MTKLILLLLPIHLLAQTSTWDIIRNDIFEPKCVMCHDHGLYFAEQSGLILAEDVAYEELINVIPTNTAAADDGLILVGTDGIPSVYNSFLWEKINANNYEHFYNDHSDYGNLMPLGMDYLTNGELEFIRQWIIAGAPDSNVVVDVDILNDTTLFEIPDFGPLPVPENGVQFHIGPFDVAPQFEREFFYFTVIDTQDILYVNRIETAMSPGSHHFVVYTFDEDLPLPLPPVGVIRDLRYADGSYNNGTLAYMSYNKFITGTQTRFFDYTLPEGVALRINPAYGFDLNPHYANYSNETIQGEVYNNYHFVDSSEVVHIAEILQINADNLVLPPGDTTTINHIEWASETMSIFQLWSHAHKYNLDFNIYRVNQSNPEYRELIYLAMDWEHPPVVEYDPPLVLHAGDGLELEATFYNDTDETIYFGLLSSDEMMILFGLYYEGESLATQDETEMLPSNISITNIFPNPFNPSTTIQFDLVETWRVGHPAVSRATSLRIFDITGRVVETLVDEKMGPGNHEIRWNASGFSSGVYFAVLTQGLRTTSQKMILMK
ncbi:MAG: T9SS type A sorting domain-containing protein [Candidatus Marinimicrobia bacterium]|nr:T9SS type A sorting domain-containing protein [Candidatus Neomarinimicrobiota bacterium]